MSSSRGFRVVVVVALSITACGGDSGPLPITDLPARVADAQCAYQVRCGVFPDVATCKESRGDSTAQMVASVNAGRLEYDGNAARACLDMVGSVGCNRTDEPVNPPLSCATTFKGRVAENGTCYMDEECVSGRCDRSSCSGDADCCPGTCEPGPAVVNPVPVGGDCSPAGASCVDSATCTYSTADNLGTCVGGIKLGEPCDPMSGVCLNHGRCTTSDSSLGGTCVPPPATGEACESDGSRCNSSKDFCDPATSRCAPKLLPGQPCSVHTGCVGYALCDATTSKCVMRRRLGEACDDTTSSADCMDNLDCDNGVCTKSRYRPPACP